MCTVSPPAAALPVSAGVFSWIHSSASGTPSSRWRARSALDVVCGERGLAQPRAGVPGPPGTLAHEQRERTDLLGTGVPARGGVEVALDLLQQVHEGTAFTLTQLLASGPTRSARGSPNSAAISRRRSRWMSSQSPATPRRQ